MCRRVRAREASLLSLRDGPRNIMAARRAFLALLTVVTASCARAPPLASLSADDKLQELTVTSDVKAVGPLNCLRIPLSPRQRRASIAGALGLAVGWAVTPTIIDPNPGRVATPEAWRRRIKAKYRVPLVQRCPRITAFGLVCFTMAEFVLALQGGSVPRTALMQTTVGVMATDAAARVAPRLEPLTSFVDARITRFLPPGARLST